MLLFTIQVFTFQIQYGCSGARIPRILNHKIMLISFLMAVSSNLIEKSLIQCIVWSFIVIPSRQVL